MASGATNIAEFERVRDGYFRDPQAPNMDDLATASTIMLNGLADPATLAALDADGLSPLQTAAAQLAAEYTGPGGARVFDHLSTGQIHPAGNTLTAVGHLAAAVLNNNTILADVSPRGVAFERTGVEWVVEHIAGYDPETASGVLTSGGTLANFTALLVARTKMEMAGWKADRPATVLATSMAHYSVKKAAQILGPCGLINVDPVPLERGSYRMDPRSLLERVKAAKANGTPIMSIVAVAGETETGLVDDLDAIAEIAEQHEVHLHVDGAYGGPFRLSRASAAFDAVSRSDSFTVDPHKYLFTPYPGGAVAFRTIDDHMLVGRLNEDGERYLHTNGGGASATSEGQEAARARFRDAEYRGRARIEGSLGDHAAVSLALVARHFGTTGVGALLDHTLDVTQAFADRFSTDDPDGLVPAHEAQLNTQCLLPGSDVRGTKGADERVKEVAKRLETEEGIYVTTTDLPDAQDPQRQHRTALRFVATHPYTTEAHAQEIADKVRKAWDQTRVA